MAYLEIDLAKIQYNALMLKKKLEQRSISMTPVIKCIASDEMIVNALKEVGFDHMADARLSNIETIDDDSLTYLLIRTPNRSELEACVKSTKMSIQTEIDTIRQLNETAKKLNQKHEILLMVDWKDSREGVLAYDVVPYIEEILHMKYLCLKGLAFNFMCFLDIPPTEEDILRINHFVQTIEKQTGYTMKIISGGNSSALPLLSYCTFGRINHLRIGEALFRGVNTVDLKPLDYLFQDAITLKAEIIEIKPRIDTNQDTSYLQAILDIGHIDTVINQIEPMDAPISLMGATSDHLMVDLKDADYYRTGDFITFSLGYNALAHSMYQNTLKHIYQRDAGVQIMVDHFQPMINKVDVHW